jgi:hypothetical protein
MPLARYAQDRPLLLWTDFRPDAGGGGAVLLRSLLTPEDGPKVVWASPMGAGDRVEGQRTVALMSGSKGRGQRRSLLLDSTIYARALAAETVRVAEAHGARAIWMVLHGAAVPIAAQLVQRTSFPVHLTVHDDPGFGIALRSRRYFALTPWIEHELGLALRGARSIDVISEGMRQRYESRFGVRSFVVHRATPGPIQPSRPYDKARDLRVAQLGNVYDPAQLTVLAEAIARASRILGVPGRLTLIGDGFGGKVRARLAKSGVEIEATGHIAEADGLRILRDSFALFLSYPFTRRQAVFRRTSFPTKVSSYVFAARPILVHAPADSSLAHLNEHTAYVHPWTTMRADDGAGALVRMWRDPRSHESHHAAADAVRASFFDPERNRGALLDALDALVSPLNARAAAEFHDHAP